MPQLKITLVNSNYMYLSIQLNPTEGSQPLYQDAVPHYYGYYQWDTKRYASIAHIHVKINILIQWIWFTAYKCHKWPSQPCLFQISCLCQLPLMGALVNILKNWTFSYRDNTFPTILDRLWSVFHESKILVRKTALHGKLDTKFIEKISANPHQFVYEVWLNEDAKKTIRRNRCFFGFAFLLYYKWDDGGTSFVRRTVHWDGSFFLSLIKCDLERYLK